jgi:photosystem II stability/assembly factor-like uncharacterized protein
MALQTPERMPRFISVAFYPAYNTGSVSGSGRYVALGDDGRVYVATMSGSDKWYLLGASQYD